MTRIIMSHESVLEQFINVYDDKNEDSLEVITKLREAHAAIKKHADNSEHASATCKSIARVFFTHNIIDRVMEYLSHEEWMTLRLTIKSDILDEYIFSNVIYKLNRENATKSHLLKYVKYIRTVEGDYFLRNVEGIKIMHITKMGRLENVKIETIITAENCMTILQGDNYITNIHSLSTICLEGEIHGLKHLECLFLSKSEEKRVIFPDLVYLETSVADAGIEIGPWRPNPNGWSFPKLKVYKYPERGNAQICTTAPTIITHIKHAPRWSNLNLDHTKIEKIYIFGYTVERKPRITGIPDSKIEMMPMGKK